MNQYNTYSLADATAGIFHNLNSIKTAFLQFFEDWAKIKVPSEISQPQNLSNFQSELFKTSNWNFRQKSS